ncbi:MAG TPA: SH3 domain-containing protein [Beijerinckiaceae bacterium]
MALRLALALAASLVACGGAHATAFCEIKPTRDGFVALRAGPGADARLLARLRVGDEVMLLEESRGGWRRVRWWRADERLARGFDRARGDGWVRASLIRACG